MKWEEVMAYDKIKQLLIDDDYLPEGIAIDRNTDFDRIEREDPECAALIYCGLMKAAIMHPEYFSKEVAAILSGYTLDDTLPFRSQISEDDEWQIEQISSSMFVDLGKKALSCVKTCSPVYYMLLSELPHVRVWSKKLSFEMARAGLYWKLRGNAQPGDILKKHIQSQIESIEHDHSMGELIQLNRLYMWLNEPEKEMEYAERLSTRCFDNGEGFQMPFSFAFCASVYLRKMLALIHVRKFSEALKMVDEEISDLENHEEFRQTKMQDTSLDDIERCKDSYADWLTNSGAGVDKSRDMSSPLECITALCEIGHWTACADHQAEKAIVYQRKYTYYMHLRSVLKKCASEDDSDMLQFAEWMSWLADHPFIPPTINTACLEDGLRIPFTTSAPEMV